MKSKYRLLLPILLSISVFCGSLTGATLYVATTGDDTNGNGSQVTPYATIQKAVDSASNGDAILVLPGTYAGSGNREINTLGKLITIQSSDGPLLTIVDCGNKQAFIANSGETQDTIIDGFSITNGYVSSGRNWSGYGVIHMENCAYTIRNCIFYDNSAVATYSTTKMAIIYKHMGNSEAGVVENCLFYNNSISGIGWTSFGGGFGGLAIGGSGGQGINPLDVTFCTFADNTLTSSGGITTISPLDGTISNSVEYNNQGLYWRGEPTKAFDGFDGVEVSYCLTSHDVPDGSVGVLSGDPIFLSEGGIDYALTAGSPAIDSGDPSLLDPDGSRADMGFRLDRFSSTTDTEAPQFQIIEGDFTWQEAKADAEARGGQLAVLNTQEKIDAANEYLLSLGTWNYTFIGLTDEEVEGSWKWVTGELLTVDNWNSGEPNGGTRENYGHINLSSLSSRLLWNDTNSGSAFSYLLEAISVPEPLAPILSLETFYESNSGESITIDATPTDGYPADYTYQWFFKAVNNSDYTLIQSTFGGTLASFPVDGNTLNNGTWKVEVSNNTGTTTAEFDYRVYADSDNDGLSDGQEEFVLGTDPNDNDSDDDTLLDGAETNTGTWVSASDTGTDPLSNDSDSDGLNDGVETNTAEYIDATDTGTDPNDSDTDNDGLLDGAETNTNVYVSSSDTGTHPLNTDSDADGYSDYVETNTGTWTSSDDTGTDPNLGDTDNDGIIDGRETNTGTFISLTDTGTDPNNTDSDGDGFTDKFEIDTSYDPTSSDDTPDAYSFIETAVEVNFYGANGGTYRIEHTEDLESDIWVTVENDIEGSSELIERLYSTDDYSRRFFRVVRTDQ